MIGLEIKRELLFGELSSFKKASFPVIAALGGMIAPGLIYFFLTLIRPLSMVLGSLWRRILRSL